MADIDHGRPDATEHIPYYAQYINLVPDGDIVAILDGQMDATAALLTSYTPVQAQWHPAPGEWSAAEIVGHLADTERVFAYRVLRIARADPVPWTSAELEGYIAAADCNRLSVSVLMADYTAVRAATVTLLRGLNDASWARRAPDGWTCCSVRALAYIIAGHELHHRESLHQQREAARRS